MAREASQRFSQGVHPDSYSSLDGRIDWESRWDSEDCRWEWYSRWKYNFYYHS